MKIPYTIPKSILRAYAKKLDEAALQKSYEGRLLVAENPNWDKDVTPTLAQTCLGIVLEEFMFFHKLIDYFNDNKLAEYEEQKALWDADFAKYMERRAKYEQKVAEYEHKLAEGEGIDYDDQDDPDDPDTIKVDANGRPIEPEKMDEEFPEYEPIPFILDHLRNDERVHIVEEIELDLVPLPLAIKILPDDFYWERQCRDRWQVFNVLDHGNRWRRMYMEKHAQDAIEKFHPADDDFDKFKEELEIVCAEVIRLNIQNLIPICFGTPTKELVPETFEGDNVWGPDDEFDQGFGDDLMFKDPDDGGVAIPEATVKALAKAKTKKKKKSGGETKPEKDYIITEEKRNPLMDRQDPSHLDFSLVFPLFKNLKELTIVVEMVETGLDWESRYFKFTDKDCLSLANALAETPTIEKFELLRSKMNGEQCKTLVREGLIKMPHLKYLNLNYNRIDDVGARAVARLLIDKKARALHTLHTLRVARNRIHNAGGKALAYALTRNTHLTVFDGRLNSFRDPAACDFGHALAKNDTILAVFLGANKFTEESAYIIGKMLFHNKTLKELDISSNDLGKKGGEYLALGMRNNRTILKLDVRCCNIGLDFTYDIGTQIKKNRLRFSQFRSIVDGEDYDLNDTESVGSEEDLEDEEEEESGEELFCEDEDGEEEECEEEEEEEEEEECPEIDASMGGTQQPQKKLTIKIHEGLLTPAMLANAGLVEYPRAVALMGDPQIAQILEKAMIGPKKTAEIEPSTSGRTRSKKGNKELKVVKAPQEMQRSNQALA